LLRSSRIDLRRRGDRPRRCRGVEHIRFFDGNLDRIYRTDRLLSEDSRAQWRHATVPCRRLIIAIFLFLGRDLHTTSYRQRDGFRLTNRVALHCMCGRLLRRVRQLLDHRVLLAMEALLLRNEDESNRPLLLEISFLNLKLCRTHGDGP